MILFISHKLIMNAVDLLKDRRSIRRYKDEVVENEVIEKIMEITKFAPSWCNYQIAHYTFVTNSEKINAIMEDGVHGFAYNAKTLKYAKNVAILSYVKGKSGKMDLSSADYATSKSAEWEVFDAGIACQQFCLSAHAYGIGTCVMGVIDDTEIAKILELPEDETVAAVITYGYPNEVVPPTPRKNIDKLMRFL